MSEIFIITCYDGGIYGIYTDLQTTINKSYELYKNIPDFKYYGYKINTYRLMNNEYIYSNTIYINENIFQKPI